MPPKIVDIQWNSGTHKGGAVPPHEIISKKDGIDFNVALGSTDGVRICFNNSKVFGTDHFDYKTSGHYPEPASGRVGERSTYHLQDYETTCVPPTQLDDPYSIEIGSGVEHGKKKVASKKAPKKTSKKKVATKKKVAGKKKVATKKKTGAKKRTARR